MQPSPLADAPAPGSALSSLEILWFHLVPVPPDISWWLQCCPKVAILRILSGGSPDAARTLRRTNRAERSPGGWPSLVHVGGTISDVFSLGLSQQVPNVTISFVGDTWPPLEQLGMVQAVLCDTESESLVLDLYFPEEGSDNEQVEEAFSLGGAFRRAFEGPGVGRLRRLKILQRFESEVQTLALDALNAVLDRLPLLTQIRILDIELVPSCSTLIVVHHPTRGWPTSIEINFQHVGVDPIEFSRSCFLKSAGLQHVEFVVVPCNRCGWMVSQAIKLGRDD